MFAMVHVTQVKLFAFEEDDGEAVEGQSAAYIVVEHSGAQVEPLVVLACLGQLALFFGEFSHLEVDMGLLHEISLLYTRLRFHDQVLRRLPRRMRHTPRSRTEWNRRRMMILRLAPEPNVAQRILDDRLEDVRWLHTNLLREAPMLLVPTTRTTTRSSRLLGIGRLHVELVHDDFENVELLHLKVPEQLLISLVRSVKLLVIRPNLGRHWPAELLIDLVKETIAAILQPNDLIRLELLHVVFVACLLCSVIALIHHV